MSLTPQLNADQLKQNITALQKGGVSNDKVQAYVNNYKSDGKGGYVLVAATHDTSAPTTPTGPNLGQRLITDTEGHAANIAQDVSSGVENAEKEPNTLKAVGQAAESGLDIAGNIAGEVGDFFGEPLKSAWNTAVPQSMKDGLSSATKSVAGTPAAQGVLKAYSAFQAAHPDAAKNIGNVVNIASLFGGGEAASGAGDAVTEGAAKIPGAVAATKDALSEAAGGAKDAVASAVKAPINAAKDLATPIDENVMTVLKSGNPGTEGTLKNLFTQAKTAVSETGTATPFDSVGKKTLGGALSSLKDQLGTAGKKASEALSRVGSKPIDVSESASDFYKQLEDKLGTTIGPDGALQDAGGRVSLVANSPSDAKLVKQVAGLFDNLTSPKYGGATVQKVSDAVDSIQAQLYKAKQLGAEPLNSQTEGVMKQIIGKLNGVLKGATSEVGEDGVQINPFADANARYAKLTHLQTQLNSMLGKNMKNAGSVIKRVFSPQDGGVKELIAELEKETGQPIFHDATLAKFAMDAVGDPRAQSLLKTTMDVKSKGFTKSVIDYITKKLEDPEGKSIRVIQKSKTH